MSANRTEEVKRIGRSIPRGRASDCGDSDRKAVVDKRYDNDEGGATGWKTPKPRKGGFST